jgi:hypothetical protein
VPGLVEDIATILIRTTTASTVTCADATQAEAT